MARWWTGKITDRGLEIEGEMEGLQKSRLQEGMGNRWLFMLLSR